MSFGGQSVAASDKRGLFLKVFSGEVLKAFERATKVTPLVTQRVISSGKSAQFPTTGVAAARYFTPGDDLFVDSSTDTNAYLSKIKQSERIIYIDELLTSACFIDDLDEAMSHYDYRSIFAKEIGNALARQQDNYAINQLYEASLNAGDVANEETPTSPISHIVNADFLKTGDETLDNLYDAARLLDEKDVPKEDRFILCGPSAYYTMLKAGVFTIDSSAGGSDARMIFDGGGNDYVGARMTTVAGMPVVVTNSESFDTRASDGTFSDGGTFMIDKKGGDSAAEDAGSRNLDVGDGSSGGELGTLGQNAANQGRLGAMVFHKSAIGMVKLKDVTMESEYIIERQGTLMVAKLATGMGALRNDAVVVIKGA
tara:strand:+ start:296 stop:1405 length:1110 start_codon:yes stop_codon:yes gene_type:complete